MLGVERYNFLLVCSFFKGRVSKSSYVALNGLMTVDNKLQRMWMEGAMTYFRVLCWYLPRVIKNNHRLQSKELVLWSRFKPATSEYKSEAMARPKGTECFYVHI
jgi:hypothetical protein